MCTASLISSDEPLCTRKWSPKCRMINIEIATSNCNKVLDCIYFILISYKMLSFHSHDHSASMWQPSWADSEACVTWRKTEKFVCALCGWRKKCPVCFISQMMMTNFDSVLQETRLSLLQITMPVNMRMQICRHSQMHIHTPTK